MPHKIIIADDHDIIRTGIKNILRDQPAYQIIAEAGNGEEVLEKVEQLQPDILLLDISMPKLSGLDVLGQIQHISPDTKVLIISVHKANAYIMKAFASGAKGYLQKESAGEELLPALSRITADQTYLTPALSSFLIDKAFKKSAQQPQERLFTAREQEVLRLVAEGKTAKEIADLLCLSQRTVENYKETLLKKLNLHRSSDLIKYAIKHNLVEIEEY